MKKYIRDIEKAREIERKLELQQRRQTAAGSLDRRQDESADEWRQRMLSADCHPDSFDHDGADKGL